MAIRNIRKEGNPVLREICTEVHAPADSLKRLIGDMFETMYEEDGVGLAAPQIGISKRIVVIDDRNGNRFALINPVITESAGQQISDEGCLSLPGFAGKVKRPLRVKVEALNEDGEAVSFEATDRLAVIVCHELDHLDGILYKDKAIEFWKVDDN